MSQLLAELLQIGKTIDRTNFFPTLASGATEFVLEDPFAFLLACCLDRGTKTELIWTIPYDLRKQLGHLEPSKLAAMSLDQLAKVVDALQRKPRYVHATPRTIFDLSKLVDRELGARLWQGRTAAQFQSLLRTVHGVGPQLANMTPLLVEKAFGVRFPDRATIDIKADVHTMRVLTRAGLAKSEDEAAAIAAARLLSPTFPGEVDAPLWKVGRTWCFPTKPACRTCPLHDTCARVGT